MAHLSRSTYSPRFTISLQMRLSALAWFTLLCTMVVGQGPEEAGVAGGGGRGQGRGLRAVVEVEFSAVAAAGEAVCSP